MILELGFECTKRLRQLENEQQRNIIKDHNRNNYSIPISRQLVIACSANADEETAEIAYDAGK